MVRGTYWDSPVLDSVMPVVERSRHVSTDGDSIDRVAGWMAYEEFGSPAVVTGESANWGSDPVRIIDVSMLISTLNFAFTDFETGVKFEVERDGVVYSDSDAMFARIAEALDKDVPLLDGAYLSQVTRDDLARLFVGNIEMPMLEERAAILREVGETLVNHYGGSFYRFVRDCAPAMYADGDGLLERLVVEFPRFNDVSVYHGNEVKIFKLAQLSLWSLERALSGTGAFHLRDLDQVTAFADYIVPVGLRLMDIFRYSDELEAKINKGVNLDQDSDEEIEIRAHTLYATACLTDAINKIRPADTQLVIPQVDYRLWKTYHSTFWPHHLTRTIMY